MNRRLLVALCIAATVAAGGIALSIGRTPRPARSSDGHATRWPVHLGWQKTLTDPPGTPSARCTASAVAKPTHP